MLRRSCPCRVLLDLVHRTWGATRCVHAGMAPCQGLTPACLLSTRASQPYPMCTQHTCSPGSVAYRYRRRGGHHLCAHRHGRRLRRCGPAPRNVHCLAVHVCASLRHGAGCHTPPVHYASLRHWCAHAALHQLCWLSSPSAKLPPLHACGVCACFAVMIASFPCACAVWHNHACVCRFWLVNLCRLPILDVLHVRTSSSLCLLHFGLTQANALLFVDMCCCALIAPALPSVTCCTQASIRELARWGDES